MASLVILTVCASVGSLFSVPSSTDPELLSCDFVTMASKCVIDVDTLAKMLRSVVKELQQDLHLSPSLEAIAVAFSHLFVAIAAITPRLNASLVESALPLVWEGAKPDQCRCAARQLALSFSHCKVLEKSFQSGTKTHPKVTPILLALRKWSLQGASPPDSKRSQSFTGESSMTQASSSSCPSVSHDVSIDGSVLSLYGLQPQDVKHSSVEVMAKYAETDDVVDVSSDEAVPVKVHSSASSAQVSSAVSAQAAPASSSAPSSSLATGSAAVEAAGFVDVCRKLYVTLDMGVRQEFPLMAGPNGFCVSVIKGQGGQPQTVSTEVPNDLIAVNEDSSMNADSSTKKVAPMKRPSAAAATAVVKKRPAARPSRAVPDDDDDDDDDHDAPDDAGDDTQGQDDDQSNASVKIVEGSQAVEQAAGEHAFNVTELVPLYYSSSNSAALRVPGGKQVLNLSGQWCRDVAKKHDVLEVLMLVKQKLVDDGCSIQAAKTWGQKQLAERVMALKKEAQTSTLIPNKAYTIAFLT